VILESHIQNFIQSINNKEIFIYGAGYVADVFFKALKKNKLEKQVKGFLVSSIGNIDKVIHGYLVRTVDEVIIGSRTIICIAVHEIYKKEIEEILFQKGISNYIWIYPILYELYLGDPIREKEWINIKKIIKQQLENYGIAIRWAAIDDYYGKSQGGFALYKKAIALHSDNYTAEERTKQFIGLIETWSNIGYLEEYQISLDRNYKVIDGEHRLTLALYHGQEEICCKVYREENIHTNKALITRQSLIEGEFYQEEIMKIENINQYLESIVL